MKQIAKPRQQVTGGGWRTKNKKNWPPKKLANIYASTDLTHKCPTDVT